VDEQRFGGEEEEIRTPKEINVEDKSLLYLLLMSLGVNVPAAH